MTMVQTHYIIDFLWNSILQIPKKINDFEGQLSYCHFDINGQVTFNSKIPNVKAESSVIVFLEEPFPLDQKYLAAFYLKDLNNLELLEMSNLAVDELQLLNNYLPYCFLSIFANKHQRAISVGHFAQSLDGKIATKNGSSQWIGNRENLVHAHRMRALCNAVLIGKNTLKIDKPRLTVRMVKGDNPIRVVIGNANDSFECLTNSCPDTKILVYGNKQAEQHHQIEYIPPVNEDTKWQTNDILENLYQQGIYSVYVEGGAKISSSFLCDGMMDIMQLHISPLLFGSGRAISLPEIETVDESISFENIKYQIVGNSIMFVGQPQKRSND